MVQVDHALHARLGARGEQPVVPGSALGIQPTIGVEQARPLDRRAVAAEPQLAHHRQVGLVLRHEVVASGARHAVVEVLRALQ